MSAAVNQAPGNCMCVPTCLLCVTVKTCPNVLVSGAVVALKDSTGTTTYQTLTTGSSGVVCFDLIALGLPAATYLVDASKTGQAGSNRLVAMTCPGETDITMRVDFGMWQARVRGCALGQLGNLPGATVAIGGGVYTTDVNGLTPSLALASGTYTMTITATRWQTFTTTVSIVACGAIGVVTYNLAQKPGYSCIPGCPEGVAQTLHATTPMGAVTMTWQLSGSNSQWIGCGYIAGASAVGVPDCFTLSAQSVPFYIVWDSTARTFSVAVYKDRATFTNLSTGTLGAGCGATGACGIFVNTAPVTPTIACPPAFSGSATISGQTGITAILNGTYTWSE